MKKILIVLFVTAIAMVASYGMADAVVDGVCNGCHTMHNSQNGTTLNGQSAGRNYLLLNTCVPCHTTANALGPRVDSDKAGGSFDAATANDTKVHNVADFDPDSLTVDGELGNTPPGGTGALSQQISCAGSYGCHGDPTTSGSDAGILGWHHGSKGTGSYRFLSASSTGITIVTGEGDDDWEGGSASGTNHNIYSAYTTQSISSFCSRCHGLFHGTATTGSVSPFKRHPTENRVSKYTITESQEETPYGFAPSDFDVVSPTNATNYTETYGYVTCITCHRAHGSAYPDLLRFDYATVIAGSTSGNDGGCERCHTAQQ